jgi:hypothetical protein
VVPQSAPGWTAVAMMPPNEVGPRDTTPEGTDNTNYQDAKSFDEF